MKVKVSVLILARNEEKAIGACIKSALFADEIIVIDDDSDDRTADIARGLGAKVVKHALDGNWGQQQTFAIQQASNKWIYFLDADERITPQLKELIIKAIDQDEDKVYCNSRLNYFWGQPLLHGGWFPDYVPRLMPAKDSYVTGFVHPQFHYPYPEEKFPEKAYLIHFPYRSWEHYFNKFNHYTTLAARKNKEAGKKGSFTDIISHPIAAFMKMYIIKSGWKDGKIGFILACFHFAYTMAKYVKLYYMDKDNSHVGEDELV